MQHRHAYRKIIYPKYYIVPSFIYSWSISHILEHEFFFYCQWKWEKNPQKLDTLAKLHKFSVLAGQQNLSNIIKSARFIWVFIILGIYNFGLQEKPHKYQVLHTSSYIPMYIHICNYNVSCLFGWKLLLVPW